jgi:hypothetical protein
MSTPSTAVAGISVTPNNHQVPMTGRVLARNARRELWSNPGSSGSLAADCLAGLRRLRRRGLAEGFLELPSRPGADPAG